MRIINSTDAGFFANLCDAIRHIHLEDGPWCVNWAESHYLDPVHGRNAFDYYFDQEYKPEDLWLDPNVKIVKGYTEIPEKGAEFRKVFNKVITEKLKLNDTVLKYIERAQEEGSINSGTLGVHVRYTDKYNGNMFGEPATAAPIPLQIYLNIARRAFEADHYNNVFLATDDSNVVEAFTREFGTNLVVLESPRSSTREAVHSGHKNISGYLKGLCVLVDAYMLSKCDYLIRSTSNVSSFAQFINPKLNHLNLNEVLMGDTRELEYGLTSCCYKHFL